jgi:heterodisulfide reductase subunit C
MEYLAQIIFSILLIAAVSFFGRSVLRTLGFIKIGKPLETVDQKGERWKQVIFIALGQKKMFKRPIPAILHLMVYAGFLIVNIELLEIVLDGLLGTHRLFEPMLGGLYVPLINFFEFFAVLVIISCLVFFIRRNIIKLRRFQLKEMLGWPKLDGNLILVFEIVLMLFLLNMNAVDSVRAEGMMKGNHSYMFSQYFMPIYTSSENLDMIYAIFWWAHIIGIFFFANYVPYSKHFHVFLAFPNTFYSNLKPKGMMKNMDSVTNEVKIMLGMATPDASAPPAEIGRFGAKDVVDLNQKDILGALTCTECGRCTSNCPANLTGKSLSPRKIMMDTRDRTEELYKARQKNGPDHDDGKSLLGDYITDEELFACTSCNACTETCPINIDPLNIILELRRYKAMEEAQGPSEWNGMYQSLETTFNPWKFPPTDRGNWTKDLNKA